MRRAVPPQLAKLLPLLASDQDGELVAAARAINRTLGAAGLDWHDITAAISSLVRPPVEHAPVRSWQAPPGRTSPDADTADLCRLRGADVLTEREAAFLVSIAYRLRKYGGALTNAQRRWLADLCAKVTAVAGAA